MSKIVNIFEAKTHLSQLLERVRAGEEIILAKNGKPYARLVPLETPPKRQLGFMKGTVDATFFDPLPENELSSWE
jgi:prevent-host-death family protein